MQSNLFEPHQSQEAESTTYSLTKTQYCHFPFMLFDKNLGHETENSNHSFHTQKYN